MGSEKTKFYNGVTVWGRLDRFSKEETATGKPFIEIIVLCSHPHYGDVRILGRIWGDDNVAEFNGNVADGKIKKGVDLRLQGNMQQYNGKNNIIKTTFNYYRCEPIPLKEYKAAFRLTGLALKIEPECDGLRRLQIQVIQEQKGTMEHKEEVFEVYVPLATMLAIQSDPQPNQSVHVKGYIETPMDEFGGVSEVQRPVVRVLEILGV